MFKFIDKETKGQSLTHTYPADLWQGLEQSTHTLNLNLACKPNAVSLDLTCKFSEETVARVGISY